MTVEDFIYGKEGNQKEILLYLHNLLSEMDLEAKIRYKIPFYYGRSWICYLNPLKNDGVELAFPRGYELSNEQGILMSKDRKMVLGIEFYSVEEIPTDTLLEIIQEAIILDETVPYSFKNRKTK